MKIVMEYHENRHDYVHMQWHASSPDLNIIEHAWDMLGQAVRRQDNPAQTIEELMLALQIKWANIP